MPPQAAWPEDFSPKDQTLWHCSRLGERGACTYVIDRGDIRQAIDRCSNICFFTGRWLWSVRTPKMTAWLQNSKKRAERVEIDVWAESPRLSPLWLSASSSACRAVNHCNVITPLQPTRQKYLRTESWRTRQLLTLVVGGVTIAVDAKNTKELADTKLKMMLCVMMLPLVVVSCTSKQSVSQCVKPPPPPAWIMQPPPWLADTMNGIISAARERLITLCKNNWKEPRSILMSSADRVALIDGQLMQLLWAIHTRFSRV